MRRELHRAVVGRRRDESWFWCGSGDDFRGGDRALGGLFGCWFRDGGRPRWRGRGSILPALLGGGALLTSRSAPGSVRERPRLRSLPLGFALFTRLRSSFNSRQPNVSWKRGRLRRLQKARHRPQREQHRGDPKERQPSLRPPDPDTHSQLSRRPLDVSPKAVERKGWAPLQTACTFSAMPRGVSKRVPTEKVECGGVPIPSHPPRYEESDQELWVV